MRLNNRYSTANTTARRASAHTKTVAVIFPACLRVLPACLLILAWTIGAAAEDSKTPRREASARRGYSLLLNQPYLPAAFDDAIFNELWKQWEPAARDLAESATPAERRKMAYARYGLTPRPKGAPSTFHDRPLQFVDNGKSGWAINCFACHGGKVNGQVIPGLPNSHFAFQTLTEEYLRVKFQQGKISKLEVIGSGFPLGESNGATNAVMFGVAVLAVRDDDLNFDASRPLPKFTHHDVDPPPWWHVKKKKWLYADGSTENDHRALMPFLLSSPWNSGEKVRAWEGDFKDIFAWMKTLEPPKYPFEIDQQLAQRGKAAFQKTCAQCHGTYGTGGEYPNKVVPIDVVGTDRVRLEALTADQHQRYEKSWLSYYGEKKVRSNPGGYVAQPLDGIWATAPYFHNGSVPTLWHVLHPDERPVVWQRTEDGYDQQRVGLEVAALDEVPAEAQSPAEKRRYFDTGQFGKGAGGHEFPNELSEEEKQAVLEYLKTL